MNSRTSNVFDLYRDPEAEAEILKAISFDPEQIYQVRITAQDFTDTKFRAIYEAMLTCYSDGIALDPKSVADHAAGSVKVADTLPIFCDAFTAANVQYYAKRLKEKTFARKAKEFVNRTSAKIGDPEFLHDTEKALMDLAEAQEVTVEKTTKDILKDIHADMIKARRRGIYGVPTGFRKLNDLCIGLCPRHLILLGAYTSHGKSTMLSQIAYDVLKKNIPVLIFSVEDSRQDKLTRLISTKTRIPIHNIVKGDCGDQHMQDAIAELENYRLNVYDDIYTTAEMDMKIRKHKMRGGVDIVAIDFVQNIIVPSESEIFGRMAAVAIDLQRMAKRHNVCILALSQITKAEGGKIALRGAQELASAADMVWWMHRPEHAVEKGDPNIDFIVRKNRPFGMTGLIKMRFNSTWTGIEEVYG